MIKGGGAHLRIFEVVSRSGCEESSLSLVVISISDPSVDENSTLRIFLPFPRIMIDKYPVMEVWNCTVKSVPVSTW